MDERLKLELEKEKNLRDKAISSFVEKAKTDRHILACFLYGSMARGDFWFHSDIDLLLVTSDETNPFEFRALRENGVWFETAIISRKNFRDACEGLASGDVFTSIRHNGKLLYCADSSLKDYFEIDGKLGTYEMLTQSFREGAVCALYFDKIEKYCSKGQKERAYNTLSLLIQFFASLVIILNRKSREREIIEQALALDPETFSPYPPVLYGKIPDLEIIKDTMLQIKQYILDNCSLIFQLLLDYLKEEAREIPLSVIHDRFGKLLKVRESTIIYGACEILVEKGLLEPGEYEVRLTKKSSVQFHEPSYTYVREI